ncbi:MAG: DUF302 domain-containing protein [Armatimonadota bacterium]|nr:DUF302 domain-containing protein [Armatimonadota bacterium]
MSYYFTKITALGYEQALMRVQEELEKEGFGIITEIDVRDTLKKKLDVDVRKYKILGACNPSFAHRALQVESRIGTMLPCNVIVREREDGHTEVSAINPVESMKSVANPQLEQIGNHVAAKLKAIVDRI